MRGHAGKMFGVEVQNKSTPPLVWPFLLPFLGTRFLGTLIELLAPGATSGSNQVQTFKSIRLDYTEKEKKKKATCVKTNMQKLFFK